MIKLLILALFVAILLFSFYLAYRALVHARPAKKERFELHFRGGPLDGERHYSTDYPDRYTWMFKKTIASRGTKENEVSSTRMYEAIYEHQGDGFYTYEGRVPLDQVLQAEPEKVA